MVLEYGLVGAFDTVAMLCGEEVAIIDTSRFETEPENDSNAGDIQHISPSNVIISNNYSNYIRSGRNKQ